MNLLKNVWDKDFDTNTNVVDVYVNYLRTKIDKDFEPKLIHTDRKSTRLNSSHNNQSRMPSSA